MASTSPPTELHYLTLHTRPLTSLPTINSNDYESFTAALLQESNAILDHAAWSGLKSWHGGVVETQNLPPDAVKLHAPSSSNSNSSPAPKHKKKGFFGGGGGEGADGDQVDTEGCAWHRRCSRLVGKQANFEALWETLGVRHAEQEAEYVPTLAKVLPVVDNGEPLPRLGEAVTELR